MSVLPQPKGDEQYQQRVRSFGRMTAQEQLQHFPQNWENAERLSFFYNPGEPVMLHYRVNDATHRGDQQLYGNRFNGKRLLVRGWNTIVVLMEEIENGPEKKNMNLAAIEGLGVFLVGNMEERILYIDEVKLKLKAQN